MAGFRPAPEELPPQFHDVELREGLAAGFPLLVHEPEILVAYLPAVDIYPLVGQEMADAPVDFLVAFIGLDVDERAVDVEKDGLDVHGSALRICLASCTSRQR